MIKHDEKTWFNHQHIFIKSINIIFNKIKIDFIIKEILVQLIFYVTSISFKHLSYI